MALASRGHFLFPILPSPSLSRKLVLSSSQSAGGQNPSPFPDHSLSAKTTSTLAAVEVKRCLRCGALYSDEDNSPTACAFHGHTTGERGLFSLSPPHQGIDGEWTDKSGVIVYRWNERKKRLNSGIFNWKRRWSCCSEYEEQAPPCRRGCHVSYDDGFVKLHCTDTGQRQLQTAEAAFATANNCKNTVAATATANSFFLLLMAVITADDGL